MKKLILVILAFFLYQAVVAQVNIDSTRGVASEKLAQYRQAYQHYQLWLIADTLNPEALNAVARTALQLGRIKEAEEHYLKTYTLDSTNFDAELQLAKLYFQQKKYSASLAFYDHLLEQDSTNISFLRGAGECIERMGFLPIAMNYYNAAVELNKENASLAIVLINILLALHQANPEDSLSMAMEICDTAMVYNPDNKNLLQTKGVLYFIQENYPAADSTLSILVSGGDSSGINMRYLGLTKYRQNDYYDAIPYFEKLYVEDTTNVETILLLANCLRQTTDRNRALTLFDKAEKLMYPTNEERYNLALSRADTYRASGDTKNARKYCWEAYKLSKKNRTAILFRLAGLYYFGNKSLETIDRSEYEEGLFFHVLFLREPAMQNLRPESMYGTQAMLSKIQLKKYAEDMFFKDVNKLRMTSPDGEVTWITAEELKQLTQS